MDTEKLVDHVSDLIEEHNHSSVVIAFDNAASEEVYFRIKTLDVGDDPVALLVDMQNLINATKKISAILHEEKIKAEKLISQRMSNEIT